MLNKTNNKSHCKRQRILSWEKICNTNRVENVPPIYFKFQVLSTRGSGKNCKRPACDQYFSLTVKYCNRKITINTKYWKSNKVHSKEFYAIVFLTIIRLNLVRNVWSTTICKYVLTYTYMHVHRFKRVVCCY